MSGTIRQRRRRWVVNVHSLETIVGTLDRVAVSLAENSEMLEMAIEEAG